MLVSLLSPLPLLSMFGRNVWEKVSLVSLPVGLPHRNAKQQSGQGLEGRWIEVWHFDLAGPMRSLRLHCKLRQRGGYDEACYLPNGTDAGKHFEPRA
jgi:hypothetical protein